VAAKTYSSTLHAHLLSFETCPVEVTEFCRTLITGLTTLHAMEISHGNIRPETVLIDADSIVLSEFSKSTTVQSLLTNPDPPKFTMDAKMLASTILFTLSGGLTRAISDCHFSVQLDHFIPVFRS
jgi:serine/threonine protein kinase